MENKMFLTVLILGSLIATIWGYPNFVPEEARVCNTMTPGHTKAPQTTTAPYSVNVSPTSVKGGNSVKVTLSGNGQKTTFRGFYIQARDTTGSRVGTFTPDAGKVKGHTCDGIKNIGAHHAGKTEKSTIDVYWKAPKNYNGKVTFLASFVKNFDTFWTNVKSQSVTVSRNLISDVNPTLIDTTGEERETPKETQESRILNYNSYSPFSPLRNEDFDSKEFPLPSNYESSAVQQYEKLLESDTPLKNPKTSKSSHTRRRKSKLSKSSHIEDAIIVDNPGASQRERNYYQDQKYFLPNYLKQFPENAYRSPSFPTAKEAGFYYLDNPQPPHLSDVPVATNYNNAPSFRPSFFPVEDSSRYNNKNLGYQTIYNPSISSYGPNTHYTTGPKWPKKPNHDFITKGPHQHGVLVQDVINTGIVLPNDMQSFEIPRYGYLVFNPKRGPPFYLIPADPISFENAHFGGEDFVDYPQPVRKNYHDLGNPFIANRKKSSH